jgi:hypothetical protein
MRGDNLHPFKSMSHATAKRRLAMSSPDSDIGSDGDFLVFTVSSEMARAFGTDAIFSSLSKHKNSRVRILANHCVLLQLRPCQTRFSLPFYYPSNRCLK